MNSKTNYSKSIKEKNFKTYENYKKRYKRERSISSSEKYHKRRYRSPNREKNYNKRKYNRDKSISSSEEYYKRKNKRKRSISSSEEYYKRKNKRKRSISSSEKYYKRKNNRSRSRRSNSSEKYYKKKYKRDESVKNKNRTISKEFYKAPNKYFNKNSIEKNKNDKKMYEFDSPPIELLEIDTYKNFNINEIENIEYVGSLLPSMKNQTPQEIVVKLENFKRIKKIQQNRDEKKIFIGNIPKNLDKKEILEFINKEMDTLNLKDNYIGDCAVDAWVDSANIYAFIEFRSINESIKALENLQGIKFKNKNLRLSKLKSLVIENLEEKIIDYYNPLKNNNIDILNLDKYNEILNKEFIIQPPTNILILKNLLKIDELSIDEEYNEILYDISQMAKKFGNLKSIKIPRPDFENLDKKIAGLTNVFWEYENVHEAKYSRSKLTQKLFRGRIVDISYHDPDKYKNRNFLIKIY